MERRIKPNCQPRQALKNAVDFVKQHKPEVVTAGVFLALGILGLPLLQPLMPPEKPDVLYSLVPICLAGLGYISGEYLKNWYNGVFRNMLWLYRQSSLNFILLRIFFSAERVGLDPDSPVITSQKCSTLQAKWDIWDGIKKACSIFSLSLDFVKLILYYYLISNRLKKRYVYIDDQLIRSFFCG